MDRIKVLLVDDHTLFRRGVAAVLEGEDGLQVVGEAGDGMEAMEKARATSPDVILMDLSMPRRGGLETTLVLGKEMPQSNILVLTVSDKDADLFAAVKAGAKGYLLKISEPRELVQAVFHVAKGGVIVSPQMAEKLLAEFNKEPSREPVPQSEITDLSPREVEVLLLIANGASNKEIAGALFITENTVKTHLRNILEKLHLANRSQAAAYAVKTGLVSTDNDLVFTTNHPK